MTSVNLLRAPQTDRVRYPYAAYGQLETKSDRRRELIGTAFHAAGLFLKQKNFDREQDLQEKELEQEQVAKEQEQANQRATANYMQHPGGDPMAGQMGGPGFSSDSMAQNDMANQGLSPPMTGTPDPKVVREMQEKQLQNAAYATILTGQYAEVSETLEEFMQKKGRN